MLSNPRAKALLEFGKTRIFELETRITNLGVHNLSNTALNAHQRHALGLGLNFVLRPPPSPPASTLESASDLVRRVRLRCHFEDNNVTVINPFRVPNPDWQPRHAPPAVEEALQTFTTNLEIALKTSSPKQTRAQLPQHVLRAVRQFSRTRASIVIKPADKNLGITIMTREAYNLECFRHLDDINTYIPDSTPISVTKRWLDDIETKPFANAIPKETWRYFQNAPKGGWKPCAFYAIMKVHKKVPVSRPIAASCAWITNNVSQWLHAELMPVVTKQATYLKDSASLLVLMEDTTFPQDIILGTYDVEALYPSIPLDKAIDKINGILEEERHPRRLLIIRLLEWVMYNSVVEFNGRTWKQIKGTAMGTPVAPAFAILFMSWLDKEFTRSFPTTNMLLHLRYIDDGLIIWKGSQGALQYWLSNLNGFDPNIKITWTISDASVDFLDLTLFKGNRFQATGHLDSRCYQKPMNMYLYLPFISHHTTATKKAFIHSELHRMLARTTDPQDFISIYNKFYQRLRARGYPVQFLRPIFAKVSHHHRKDTVSRLREKNPASTKPLVFKAKYEPRNTALGLPSLVKTLAAKLHDIKPNTFSELGVIAWTLPKKTQNLWVRSRLPPLTPQSIPQTQNPNYNSLITPQQPPPNP